MFWVELELVFQQFRYDLMITYCATCERRKQWGMRSVFREEESLAHKRITQLKQKLGMRLSRGVQYDLCESN